MAEYQTPAPDQLPQMNHPNNLNNTNSQIDLTNIRKAKRSFFIWLIIWLLSWPTLIFLQIIFRFWINQSASENVISNTNDFNLPANDNHSAIRGFINLISLFMGLFGMLGWIVVLIKGLKWQKLNDQFKQINENLQVK